MINQVLVIKNTSMKKFKPGSFKKKKITFFSVKKCKEVLITQFHEYFPLNIYSYHNTAEVHG